MKEFFQTWIYFIDSQQRGAKCDFREEDGEEFHNVINHKGMKKC